MFLPVVPVEDLVLELLCELPLDDVAGLAGLVQDAQRVIRGHLAVLTRILGGVPNLWEPEYREYNYIVTMLHSQDNTCTPGPLG